MHGVKVCNNKTIRHTEMTFSTPASKVVVCGPSNIDYTFFYQYSRRGACPMALGRAQCDLCNRVSNDVDAKYNLGYEQCVFFFCPVLPERSVRGGVR